MLPIGEVAKRSGVAASALRYYERAGLIPRADRQGGRRVYEDEVLDRLALIRVAKRAGFRVSEIQTLLRGLGRSTPPGTRWRALASRKRVELERRLAELETAQRVLGAVSRCECPTLDVCAQALREHGACP